VISDRLWKRRFGSGDAVGKSLRVGPITYTIVGVMPASFLFPNHDVDFWEALPVDGPLMLVREATWYNAVGRLKPGVALAQARSDLGIVQAQLGKQYPKTDATLAVHIEPLKSMTVGDVQKSLWILFGAVTVLLLIACTNIAALLLARTTERQREIAIRYSVGASRGSIIALLLTEIFVLALAGSALALLVAQTMSRVFTDLAKNLPRVEEIGMDGRVVLYTLACAIVTTLLCGLVPAIRGTKRELAGSLAQGGRSQVRGRSSLQWFLVSLQVALAVILLVGAGLLLRSFQAIARVAPGFETDHVLALRISADWAETADIKKMQQRVNRDLDGLRSVAGVEGAATSVFVPGVSSGPPVEVSIKEGAADGNQKIMAASRLVSPSYFATMHIPLLEGEACRESFGIPAMVNRSFAETYLSGRTTIGRHVQFVPANPYMPPSEIRGIVGDAREEGLQLQVGPVVYWCSSAPMPSPVFLVRTHGDPMALAETIRRKLHEVEPTRSVYEIMPLDQHLRENMAENRMRTTLLTFFATVAVLLACVGLYGTLSYVVSVRRGEVGLRLALGALRRQIVLQFLREGLAASLLGCLAGLILAAVFARVLRGMLYGVTSSDPDTFVAVALLVLVTAVVSSLLPAARAARLQPMQVLREE
jgi:predicted permease